MGEAAREAAAVGSYLNEWQPTRAKARDYKLECVLRRSP